MNITYRDLNNKEVIILKEDLINLLDEYAESKEKVIALQEVMSKIIKLKNN
jgi:hypothetical protein